MNLSFVFSKPFPLFNRCIPQTPECYSLFASVLINDVDTLQQILSGIMSGRDTILGLCILSLGNFFPSILVAIYGMPEFLIFIYMRQ